MPEYLQETFVIKSTFANFQDWLESWRMVNEKDEIWNVDWASFAGESTLSWHAPASLNKPAEISGIIFKVVPLDVELLDVTAVYADDADIVRYITPLLERIRQRWVLQDDALDFSELVKKDLDILRNKFNTQHRETLTTIWRYYVKESHWMPARLLHVTNGGKKVVKPILEQFGGSIVYEQEENGIPYYGLTFLGVLLSSEGEHIEELVSNYLRIAKTLALQEPNRTHVSSQETLTHLGLDPDGTVELGRSLFLSPFLSGGSFSSTEWNAGLPKDIEDLPDDLHRYMCERLAEHYDPDIPVIASERQAYLFSRKKTVSQIEVSALTEKHVPDIFVDETRITQLNAINTQEYDLTRLVELCRELNICFANKSYIAVAMLTRALLDHIPPIFGVSIFSEVANSYKGSRSFKESMLHLDNSCRKIADAQLHVSIREKEVLPSKTQVNFANDVDVLLAEIVRLLG